MTLHVVFLLLFPQGRSPWLPEAGFEKKCFQIFITLLYLTCKKSQYIARKNNYKQYQIKPQLASSKVTCTDFRVGHWRTKTAGDTCIYKIREIIRAHSLVVRCMRLDETRKDQGKRENPHIGLIDLIPEAILLKLLLDMARCSPVDVTRALHG